MRTASRQRVWQKRHLAQGKCVACGANRLPRLKRCLRHAVFEKLAKAGLTKGILSKTNKSLREKLAASLAGRYHAIKSGYLSPGTPEETLREATDLRIRLNIGWAGIRGARKLAHVMESLDRHALKSKENPDADSPLLD